MPITIDLADSDIYKEGVEKGLYEGEQKGLIEGEQKGLIEGERTGKMAGLLEGIEGMLELKFGLAGLELMNMVRVLNTINKLEEFKNFIKKAASIDELKEFMGKSV